MAPTAQQSSATSAECRSQRQGESGRNWRRIRLKSALGARVLSVGSTVSWLGIYNSGQACSSRSGGRYRNRPKNSLRQIFLLWLPQTFTPLDRRLHVLDRLRKIEPDSAWELMLCQTTSPASVVL